MAIRPSPANVLRRLLADLSSGDALRRESAAARLTIMGAPATAGLAALSTDERADPHGRSAALQTLGAIDSARATTIAISVFRADADVLALTAIDILGAAARVDDAGSTAALEQLAELALARDARAERRLAALSALDGLPSRLVRPIHDALIDDPSPRVRGRVARARVGTDESFEELVERGWPGHADAMALAAKATADAAPVTVLQQARDLVRAKAAPALPGEAAAWRALRGRLHAALAARGSHLGRHDLPDTLLDAAEGRLPADLVSAAAAIGDVRCLEPIAQAWIAAADGDRRLRDDLATAFAAIVTREGLTRQHPALVEILTRAPASAVLVASAPRTKRRRPAKANG